MAHGYRGAVEVPSHRVELRSGDFAWCSSYWQLLAQT
jgi:hypothetical protein